MKVDSGKNLYLLDVVINSTVIHHMLQTFATMKLMNEHKEEDQQESN